MKVLIPLAGIAIGFDAIVGRPPWLQTVALFVLAGVGVLALFGFVTLWTGRKQIRRRFHR
jgi:hypothetical protein